MGDHVGSPSVARVGHPEFGRSVENPARFAVISGQELGSKLHALAFRVAPDENAWDSWSTTANVAKRSGISGRTACVSSATGNDFKPPAGFRLDNVSYTQERQF